MAETTVPLGKPPASLNAMVKLFLRTPGLQNLLGKHLALLSFTGRRTGTRYTIPISYERNGNSVLMLTKTQRVWWRNLADRPLVELRLAGEVRKGTARAQAGTEADLLAVSAFLQKRPQDTKAYGLTAGPDGRPEADALRALLPQLVLVRVELAQIPLPN